MRSWYFFEEQIVGTVKMRGSLEDMQHLPYMGDDRIKASEQQILHRLSLSDNNNRTKRIAVTRSSRLSKQCCRCWCCCISCSCFSMNRPEASDELDANPAEGSQVFTLEEILRWKESFEKVMHSRAGRKAFREFLRTEYSEENLLFWQACEELRHLNTHDADLIEDKARSIYEDYISILSPKEVSLDARVRDIINENMIKPNTLTFEEAQMQIYTLMHRDSYPRFLNSALYKSYLEAAMSQAQT